MTFKRQIVRMLLRLYPTKWRAEYGEELEALLLLRPITASVFADVVLSAARERLKRDEPWKICGLCLFAWTLVGIGANLVAPFSHDGHQLYAAVWQLIVFLAGCWTSLRTHGGSPSWAAGKTALLGYLPEVAALVLWAAGVFYPVVTGPTGPYRLFETRLALFSTTFPTVPQAHFAFAPIAAAVVLLQAWAIGFVGGLLGRLMVFFTPSLRQS